MDSEDLEKQAKLGHHQSTVDNESAVSSSPASSPMSSPGTDPGLAKIGQIQQNNPVLRVLRNVEGRLDKVAGFEGMGVERIAEDNRRPPQILNMMFFWFSVLMSPTFVPIGMLGPIFGLSVHTCVILTVFASLTGSTMPAFTATLSPQTGLRQIALARYSMGLWGSKICSLLNVVINVGYATIAAIIAGQLLRAVSGGSLSLVVGIIVIAVATFVISFFGYRIIHHYDRYAWAVAFVLLCALWGQSHKYFTPTPGLSTATGIDYSGSCLSYFAIIFGVCCSWCPVAGDYYVHYPVKTSKWLIFGLTYTGIVVPSLFVCILGNYFGGIIVAHGDLAEIYENTGVGGLILHIMSPPSAWGKFASVIFVLTFLADCVCNVYSSALSIQLLGKHFIAVPRFFWCTLICLVVFALAYGGRNVLEEILTNLLSILGYWTLAFAEILFIEHFFFRPRLGGYDLTAWQDVKRLPVGLAGTASLLIGIGFSFLGMAQTWYIAPVAKKIGAFGGGTTSAVLMATNEEILRQRIRELEREKAEAEREKAEAEREKAEAERKEAEAERKNAEYESLLQEKDRLLQPTTLEEYLRNCQEHILSKIHLVTDGYLTTQAPSTNPARKHCPTLLAPWDDFNTAQTKMIRRVYQIFPRDKRLFESIKFLEEMGDRMDDLRVRSEASLVNVQHNAIEVPVRIIMSKINDFDPQRYDLAVPQEVNFQTTASDLRDPNDTRDTTKRDEKLRTDQICVFRNSAHQKDIAFIIEYKAPHKLHTAHFEQGLRQMNIFEEVVNKTTIPTAEPEKFKHYAELLSTAAITQTYHYMVEAGLEYGYLTNGDAIVFLNIDWANPTVLRYYLARPSREVEVDQDTAWSNAVCQVLAFTMMALQSSQHSNDERVAAANKCKKWLVDFACILDQIVKEEVAREEKAASSSPTTPATKKHRRVPSSPEWQGTPVKRNRRNPQSQAVVEPSSRVLRPRGPDRSGGGGAGSGEGGYSQGGTSSGDGGSGEAGGSSEGSSAAGASSRFAPGGGGGGGGQQRQRQYCTSSCLLSLVNDGPLDNNCPNAALHREGKFAELDAKNHRHTVLYSQFMVLLQEQLSQSLERGVVVLGKEGACGALFQITLLQFGYTFIAKGVTGGRVPDLEKEVAVYQKLRPLQGHGIPVCLGSIDLRPLGQVYFYDFDVRIIRFILLSYGGTEVKASKDKSRAHIISTTSSILDKMHRLGVVHGDVRRPNVLQGPDGEINLVDFDRAVILPAKTTRGTLSAISPNKRRRLVGSEEEEDKGALTKENPLFYFAIQQDNSNTLSLFSLDCGRFINKEVI